MYRALPRDDIEDTVSESMFKVTLLKLQRETVGREWEVIMPL